MTDSSRLHAQLIDAFNGREWDRVSALSMPLLAACPDDADLHFIAGTAALERRELRRALQHLHRAFELAPRRAEFPANLARALSMPGESRQAKEFADVAWACSPSNPATLDILGNVYSECSAHAMALLAFKQAVMLAPRHAPLRYNLATGFVNAGDIAQASRRSKHASSATHTTGGRTLRSRISPPKRLRKITLRASRPCLLRMPKTPKPRYACI